MLCITKYLMCPQEAAIQHSSLTNATNTTVTALLVHNISYHRKSATKMKDNLPHDMEERKATAFSVLYWPDGGDGLPLIPYMVVDLSA